MILATLAVLVGAATQRIAGMGFAMVVAPFVVVAFGPLEGVVIANVFSAVAAALTWWQVRHDVEWRSFTWLIVPSLPGIALGAFVARQLPEAPLQVVLGVVLGIAVVASVAFSRTALRLRGRRWQAVAGAATGTLVASAGIGGPPMSIYAVLSRWSHRGFVATMQPYQAVLSAVAVGTSVVLSAHSWPQLTGGSWLVLSVALALGLLAGACLARRVTATTGRRLVVVLALLGAVSSVANGLQHW